MTVEQLKTAVQKYFVQHLRWPVIEIPAADFLRLVEDVTQQRLYTKRAEPRSGSTPEGLLFDSLDFTAKVYPARMDVDGPRMNIVASVLSV